MATVSKKTYKLFDKDLNIVETFLAKKDMFRVLLGASEAENLLSPGHFVCPINQCKKLKKLKNFNSMSLLRTHLVEHKIKKDATAEVLVNRYFFMTEYDWWEQNSHLSLEEKIVNINTKFLHDNSLTLDTNQFFIAKKDASPKVKGHH